MQEWLKDSPIAHWLKGFLLIVVTAAVADWVKAGTIDFANWQPWVIGALAALLLPASVALNSKDTRYGRTDGSTGDESGEVGVSLILCLVATVLFAVAFALVLFKGGDARLIEELLLLGLAFFAGSHLV